MGDRSNVILKLKDADNTYNNLYLYSHWGGQEFQRKGLAHALEAARERWDDEAYFTRIVISQMFRDLIGSTTGGGISLYPCDNEYNYNYVRVDVENMTVELLDGPSGLRDLRSPDQMSVLYSWTYQEYIDEFCN